MILAKCGAFSNNNLTDLRKPNISFKRQSTCFNFSDILVHTVLTVGNN